MCDNFFASTQYYNLGALLFEDPQPHLQQQQQAHCGHSNQLLRPLILVSFKCRCHSAHSIDRDPFRLLHRSGGGVSTPLINLVMEASPVRDVSSCFFLSAEITFWGRENPFRLLATVVRNCRHRLADPKHRHQLNPTPSRADIR